MDPTSPAACATHFTVPALWRRSAWLYGDRVAVASADVELTYAQLDERTNRLAGVIARSGLGSGDRLTVLSTTRPEYVELYIAAAKLGVTVVALNFRQSADELAHCLELTRPRLLFASPDQADAAAALQHAHGEIAEVVVYPDRGMDPASSYERRLAAEPAEDPRVDPHPEDIHCILFTSGTTGKPKGAMISQRASVTRAMRCADWFDLGEDDGVVGWIPMFHTGGDEVVKATFLTGGRFATLEKADPAAMFSMIERHRLSWTPLLPGVITEFLHHPARTQHDLSSFRFALGYANMMPRVVEEFTATTGAQFWDTYGQTESSFVVALGLVKPGGKVSFRKRPAPFLDVRIVDGELNELPIGEPGECVVRGPSVMSGYVDNPEATAEAFRGGWLHTGDVLSRAEDGTLTYVDRLKYMIKTGGENVFPAEIEQVISSHPSVREACALGVPDERWGEAIKAVVVTEPGSQTPAAEINDWCRERLPGFKRPRYIQFIADEEVPRSITGKILRHELDRQPVTDDQRV